MRSPNTFAALFVSVVVSAQLDMPARLVLDGAQPADRQITGLGIPSSPDAAVSMEAARATTMSYAEAFGTTTITASLTPAPSAYSTGMMVTLLPMMTNDAGSTLDLNGLGARSIVKLGQVPLDSSDMRAGIPVRLVYDGNNFLLLNDNALPCRTGYSAYSSSTCIMDSSLVAQTFHNAVAACAAAGARLCTMGEWANACRVHAPFIGTVSDYEWVDDGANNSNDAKTVGAGWVTETPMEGFGCNFGLSRAPTLSYRYRCCTSR